MSSMATAAILNSICSVMVFMMLFTPSGCLSVAGAEHVLPVDIPL